MLFPQIISREKISQLVLLVNPYIETANNMLAVPTQIILSKLSLRTECLPETLKIPINFTLACLFIIFYIIAYTDDIIYNLIGAVYPILHSLYLFEENPLPAEKLMTMNKYWILFMLIMLLESIGGFVLYFVPFYSYGKIIFVYGLIRDDFSLTNYMFDLMKTTYAQLDQQFQISSYVEGIKLN